MNSWGSLMRRTPLGDFVIFGKDDSIYVIWGWVAEEGVTVKRFFSGCLAIGPNRAISDRDEGHLIMLGVFDSGRQGPRGFIWNFDSQAELGDDLLFDYNDGESLTDAAQKERPRPTTCHLKAIGDINPEGQSQYHGPLGKNEEIILFLQRASIALDTGLVGALAIT